MLFIYSLISVIIISLISLLGIILFPLKKISLYLVSLAAGALLGDVFLHILPEIKFDLKTGLWVLSGFLIFFIIEKIIHWKHCRIEDHSSHHHSPLAIMNLIGDGVHNFLDGLIISASYLLSIPIGIASTIAIIFHEIPQEIGDFGVLLHSGLSRSRALFLNFIISLSAILGVILGFILSLESYLIPLAAGGFIYIAGVDLIPELHKEKSFKTILFFILGIIIMLWLKLAS